MSTEKNFVFLKIAAVDAEKNFYFKIKYFL